MNFFGSKLPKQAKQGIVKIALLILGICVFITMPLIASLGWFNSNAAGTATGMQVVLSTEKYDILIASRPAAQYDPLAEDSEHNLRYPNITDLTDLLDDYGYDFTETSTSVAPALALELTNSTAGADKNLMPGSSGTLEFYIRPTAGAAGTTVTLTLGIKGYGIQYRQENAVDVPYAAPVNEAAVNDLLLGHFLFFTGYDSENHRYSGLITDGTFEVLLDSPTPTGTGALSDCYKVTLYWEWPVTYEEILEETSTTSPAVARKYPAELADYWDDNRNYFFATNPNASSTLLLSDGYNDGDQTIADKVRFLVVTVK